MTLKLDLNRFIPKWDRTNILYERKESDSGTTMISRKHPELQQLFYNQTTLFILELCDGKKTIEEIVGMLNQRYTGVQYDEIINDTIATIHTLWRLGYIIWNSENPFHSIYGETIGDYHYSLLDEDQSVFWMEHNKPCFITPMSIKESNYTETAIKQNSFLFYESFFQLKRQDKELVTLSLVTPISKECYFKVGIMNYDANEEEAEVVSIFLRWACKKFKQFSPLAANVESVLWYVRPLDSVHIRFLKTFFKAESVGVLHKELQDCTDVEIYQSVIK